MTQTNTGFGKAKYGGAGGFSKTFRLKEGTLKFRMLPPMKSLAEAGTWKLYKGTHFGYKGVNPKDASKPFHRTFECIQVKDWRTKIVTQDCPEHNLIAQVEQELGDLRDKLKREKKEDGKAKYTDDEIEELTKSHTDWLQDHNCDWKWHINVKNVTTGEFGTLQLPNKTQKLVDKLIAELLTEKGIDALDLEQGVVFVFTRSGKGIETQDTVTVEREQVRVGTDVLEKIKLAPLSQQEVEQALRDCPDLTTVVTRLTYEQIELLAKCSGEPEDVDKILAMGARKESSPGRQALPQQRPAQAKSEVKEEPAKIEAKPKEEPAPSASPSGGDDGDDVEDEEALLQRQLQELKAKKAAAKAAASETSVTKEEAPKAESAPAKPAETPAGNLPGGLDRKKFMERFGKK